MIHQATDIHSYTPPRSFIFLSLFSFPSPNYCYISLSRIPYGILPGIEISQSLFLYLLFLPSSFFPLPLLLQSKSQQNLYGTLHRIRLSDAIMLRSPASATISFRDHTTSTISKVVPPSIEESTAALEMLGFNTRTAHDIYSDWCDRPFDCWGQNPDELIDYVLGHIRGYNRNGETNTNPRAAMHAMGLVQEFSDTLLDPAHAKVRGSETLM